jgi:hypothetical protein
VYSKNKAHALRPGQMPQQRGSSPPTAVHAAVYRLAFVWQMRYVRRMCDLRDPQMAMHTAYPAGNRRHSWPPSKHVWRSHYDRLTLWSDRT